MKIRSKSVIYLPVFLVQLLLLTNSCKEETDTPALLASVTTSMITNVTLTTATGGGTVTTDGGADVTERGICWGTSANATIANYKTIDDSGTGSFTSSLTELTANTTYYVRAYALNSEGISYGNEQIFTTQPIVKPAVTTTAASDIKVTIATAGGNITADGGGVIIERGICYSTSQNPTVADNKNIVTGTTGIFSCSLTGLTYNTTYYLKAFATNSAGTSYGQEISFKTFAAIDGDGNLYHSVIIGAQEWLVENLKTTKYNDGSGITLVEGAAEWAALTGPAYCWYNNDAATNKEIFGALYNWYTVDPASNGNKNIAPEGWHVPALNEWWNMQNYMIANGYNYDGTTTENKIVKSLSSLSTWASSGNAGSAGNTDYPAFRNKSGFSAVAGGIRFNDTRSFSYINEECMFWFSSDQAGGNAWETYIGYSSVGDIYYFSNKRFGFSVRCLKDQVSQ